MTCVGYDARDPGSRYGVILNSWGMADRRRPLGTFRVRMDLDFDLPVYRGHADGSAIAFEALAIEFADPLPGLSGAEALPESRRGSTMDLESVEGAGTHVLERRRCAIA